MKVLAAVARLRRSAWWRLVLRPLLFLVISVLVARLLMSLVGSVDWSQVLVALGQLTWAHLPALAVLLFIRQAFNSVPLATFVPGLGFWRAFQSDLTANLVGTVSPPPGDVVIRVSMFRTWGITAIDGMPGVTLNSLAFYVIRFSVPILGAVMLIEYGLSAAQTVSAVVSLLVAAAIVVVLVLLVRGQRFARLLGWQAARIVSRFREGIDSEAWADKVSTFRGHMSQRISRGLPRSMAALTAMVLTDGVILVASLRFVGVDSGTLSLLLVLGSFLVAYVLTALPLAGLGVLDAALVVAFTDVAGTAAEPQIVSALVIWRVVTILGPLLLGAGTFGWWRWQVSRRNDRTATESVENAGQVRRFP